MGRYLRDVEKGGVYHVTFKVQNDEFRLVHQDDILILMALLVHYKMPHGVKVTAHSIMSNHVHLIMENSETDEMAVCHYLRDVKRQFAKYYNISYGRRGNFWVSGFHCREIRDYLQYVYTIVYILCNAVLARKCQRAEDYAHTSFHLLLDEITLKDFEDCQRFMTEEEAEVLLRKAKLIGYAGRLPEEERAARGLGWELTDKSLKPLVHQGRREYKRRGPKPYWHPEDFACTHKEVKRTLSRALNDTSPMLGVLEPRMLREMCVSRSGINETQWNRLDGQRIIFESCSRKACQKYQADHIGKLPPNAELPQSVQDTSRGTWALVVIQGRPRRRE